MESFLTAKIRKRRGLKNFLNFVKYNEINGIIDSSLPISAEEQRFPAS